MKLIQQVKEIIDTGKCSDIISLADPFQSAAISPEELRFLHDAILSPHVSFILHVLEQTKFLDIWISEFREIVNFRPKVHHKEVWPHTLTVVSQTPARLSLRWAAFFHDFGKAKTFAVIDGNATFHGHEHVSAEIFKNFANKTNIFSSSMRKRIKFIVYNLGYVESYTSEWADSGIRRFAKESGEYLDDLLDLSRADITTKYDNKRKKILDNIDELKRRIIEIQEADERAKSKLPKGFGLLIMKEFNLSEGEEVGKMRQFLHDKIEEGVIESYKDNDYYMNYLKEKYKIATNNEV